MSRDLTPEARFLAAIPDALAVVDAVHSRDDDALRSAYSRSDLPAVLVALAALVPQDRTVHDLLAWTTRPTVPPVLCDPRDWGASRSTAGQHGTRKRYAAGCRGVGCKAAETEYQAARHLRRKAAAAPLRLAPEAASA